MAEPKEIVWADRKRTFLGLPWSFTKYRMSEERLFIESGFFSTTENEVRLYRILDVRLTRTLFQRMVGVGTIHVSSSDKSLGNFHIESVKNPHDVKELLSDLVEKQRDEKRVVSREYMSEDVDMDCDYDEN